MLFRSTLIYGPAIVLPRLAAFLTILVLTHVLPVSEYGLYALVIVVSEFIDMVSSGWIRLVLLRLDGSHPEGLRSAVFHSYRLASLSFLVGVVACAIVAQQLVPERSIEFAASCALYIAANSTLRLALTILRMQERGIIYSAIEGTRAIGFLCSAYYAATSIGKSFFVVSIATSIVTAALAITALVAVFLRLSKSTRGVSSHRERLVYGLPLMLQLLASYFIMGSDRVFLKLLTSPAMVGIYAATYAIARQPIDVVSNSIVQGSYPELVKRYDREGIRSAENFLRQTIHVNLIISLPTGAILCALGARLVALLLPPAYHSVGADILPYIVFGALFYNLKSYVLDNVLLASKKNWVLVASYLPPAISIGICSLLLTPKFGALGAAIAMNISTGLGLIGTYFVVRKYLHVSVFDAVIGQIVIVSLGTYGILRLLSSALDAWPSWFVLLCGFALGGLIVLLSAFHFRKHDSGGDAGVPLREVLTERSREESI